MARSQLRHRALARLPLAEEQVERLYVNCQDGGMRAATVRDLAESHERLRAELQGAEILLEDERREVAAVLIQLDELAGVWGDEAAFRRCRDRLRSLLAEAKP